MHICISVSIHSLPGLVFTMYHYTSMHTHICTPVSDARAIVYIMQEQDNSSDIEQQPPFGDCKYSNTLPQKGGGGVQNQRKHNII